MRDYVKSSYAHLMSARRYAETLRHDDQLHRIAMRTVFLLEDCHETFVRLVGEPKVWQPKPKDGPRTPHDDKKVEKDPSEQPS